MSEREVLPVIETLLQQNTTRCVLRRGERHTKYSSMATDPLVLTMLPPRDQQRQRQSVIASSSINNIAKLWGNFHLPVLEDSYSKQKSINQSKEHNRDMQQLNSDTTPITLSSSQFSLGTIEPSSTREYDPNRE